MIFVSACLCGDNCKYNGKNNYNEKIMNFLKNKEYIKICPECMGGLDTPRPPAEIVGDKVITVTEKDVTKEFKSGAEKTLELAKKYNPEFIILKAKSPSCGFGKIYDGTFTNTLTDGNGITSQLLYNNGFKIVDENFI